MAGERILVVEDESSIAGLCHKILTGKGYEVQTANNCARALELFKAETYDILMTDLMLPDMEGLQLIQLAKITNPDIAVMVMTGHGTLDSVIGAVKLGVTGFVAKPLTPNSLLSAVLEVLRKRQIEREGTRMKLLMPLFEVTQTMMAEVDLSRILNLIVSYAVEETKAEEGSLLIVDGAGQLRRCVVTDYVPEMTGLLKNQVGEHIARWILEYRRPLMLHRNSLPENKPRLWGLNTDFSSFFQDNDLLSILSVPLIKKDQMIGVLNLSKLKNPAPFSEADQELITILCNQAAVAIENARLFRQLQLKAVDLEEASFNAIRALAQALETKNWQDWDSNDRLIYYALSVARKLDLVGDEIRKLKYAAVLHDIGQIGVKEAILKKSGKFGEKEFREIQNHPFVGAQIVRRIKFLDDVEQIVHYHHERWDGKGYPEGLKGDQIPICARILSVVDAFDAMTSDRPYRKAMPLEVVIAELQRCAGSQFDPKVVGALLAILEQEKEQSINHS